MKSVGNRDVVQSRLQMLHVHVLLVAPLCSRHMTQPCTDQHQRRVPIEERSRRTCPAADLTVQPFDHIVGADTRPVLAGKITAGQRLLDAVLDLLGSFLQLHRSQLGNDSSCLLEGGFFALQRVDRLEHFRCNLDL